MSSSIATWIASDDDAHVPEATEPCVFTDLEMAFSVVVRRNGDLVRANARLTEAVTMLQQWINTFSDALGHLTHTQGEAALRLYQMGEMLAMAQEDILASRLRASP